MVDFINTLGWVKNTRPAQMSVGIVRFKGAQ